MTADAALDLVRAYWTTHLGFDPDRANGVLVARPQGTMAHYTGIYAFRHGYSLIISPPDAYRAQLRDAVAGRTPDAAFDAALLTSALDGAAGDVIGPAYIGVADAEDFTRADASFVRTLQPSDRPALLALAEAAGPTAWSTARSTPSARPSSASSTARR